MMAAASEIKECARFKYLRMGNDDDAKCDHRERGKRKGGRGGRGETHARPSTMGSSVGEKEASKVDAMKQERNQHNFNSNKFSCKCFS